MKSGITMKMTPVPKASLLKFDALVEGYLESIGEVGAEIMKEEMLSKLPNGDATGDTRKSFTFSTAILAKRPEKGDTIEQPTSKYAVNIGSAHPNALFTEYGTARHMNKEGQEEFVRAIKEWMELRGIDPKYEYAIIKKIREQGTEARPYVIQSFLRIKKYAEEKADRITKALGDSTIAILAQAVHRFSKTYNKGIAPQWNEGVGE